APVLARTVDYEIRRRLPRPRQLRPDAGVVCGERAIRQPRPVVADARVECLRTCRVDVVVLALDPFDVRPEAHAPGEVERHMDPEAAWHRHRINQPRESRPAAPAE